MWTPGPPLVTRCVTLGKSSTISGLGGLGGGSGLLSPAETSHQGGGIRAPHIWGLGSWWLGRDALPRKLVIIPAGDQAPY